jgi:hypothetical protein
MDIPDWLWQELMADAIWTGIAFGAAWAWKNREAILRKLGKRQPVLLSGEVSGGGNMEGTLTAGTERQILYDVRSLVGSERQILYNVEAPTPSLARRLEELASWYLHVS